jgi:hypothetical protein
VYAVTPGSSCRPYTGAPRIAPPIPELGSDWHLAELDNNLDSNVQRLAERAKRAKRRTSPPGEQITEGPFIQKSAACSRSLQPAPNTFPNG